VETREGKRGKGSKREKRGRTETEREEKRGKGTKREGGGRLRERERPIVDEMGERHSHP
jgi:hypothetical protein